VKVIEKSPFDRELMTSYWCSIVTIVVFRVVSGIFTIEKYCDLEIPVKGRSRLLKVVPFDRLCNVYGFLLVIFSNFVSKMHYFWDIWLVSIQWPWNPGLGSSRSSKMIPFDPAHDFLLTFHSKHWPILHLFRDKRRFLSKIANLSYPCVFCAPSEWVRPRIGYRRRGGKKLEWWGCQMVEKVLR